MKHGSGARRWRTYLLICGAAANLAIVLGLASILLVFPGYSLGDLLHKGQMRISKNHPTIAQVIGGVIHVTGLQPLRETADNALPPFPGPEAWPAQGPISGGFERIRYDPSGRPQQVQPGAFEPGPLDRVISVSNVKTLSRALSSAKAGDVITLEPGTYRMHSRRIKIYGAGLPDRPITVRAQRFGEVELQLDTLEGFYVNRPYWLFENLRIRGTCANDSRCEHAFHVVGNAIGTTLRNNELLDFNAPLKVNGLFGKKGDRFPDYGLVHNNSVYNTHARRTDNPVSLLNINAADGWVVSANFIADFAKGKGNRVSYAAFMKSNSSNGVFERNLVVCHWRLMPEGGVRLGLSFGGGGSAAGTSRHRSNKTEHTAGTIRNNVIARCPFDVGVYLNKAAYTQVHNNLLIDTVGIDVRFATSSASIHNNILDGRILNRNGGTHNADNNVVSADCSWLERVMDHCGTHAWYQNARAGDLRVTSDEKIVDKGNTDPRGEVDFCGTARGSPNDIGPIEYGAHMTCLPTSAAMRASRL